MTRQCPLPETVQVPPEGLDALKGDFLRLAQRPPRFSFPLISSAAVACHMRPRGSTSSARTDLGVVGRLRADVSLHESPSSHLLNVKQSDKQQVKR